MTSTISPHNHQILFKPVPLKATELTQERASSQHGNREYEMTRSSPSSSVPPSNRSASPLLFRLGQEKPTRVQAHVLSRVQKKKQQLPVDPVDKLQSSLAKFTRSSDRHMMIRTIQTSPILNKLQMSSLICKVPLEQTYLKELEQEVAAGTLCINSVPIQGFGVQNQFQYLQFLKKLCKSLAMTSNTDVEELFQKLLLHVAPSSHVAETSDLVNSLLGSPDLIVQPPKRAPPMPSDMKIYSANDEYGHVHAEITTKHPFGLFRNNNIRPWIRLIVNVQERVNLTTGSSVRFCTVQVFDK